jgi:rhodanese-related sulfurtransferase
MEERVRDAKSRIHEVAAPDAIARSASGEVVLLDVREANEWNLFRIPGAVHLPLATVAERVGEAVPHDREVIVYCAGGTRSAVAADEMQRLGYTNVSSLAGGIRAWASAGGALED